MFNRNLEARVRALEMAHHSGVGVVIVNADRYETFMKDFKKRPDKYLSTDGSISIIIDDIPV